MHAHSLVRHLGTIAALVGAALVSDVATSGSASVVNAVGFTAADMTPPVEASTGPLASLQVPPVLRRPVERMWRASPTFRRQCLRLTEASLTVTVYATLPWTIPRASALARIELKQGVARHATVYLDSRLMRVPEALAHEIEHVLEQLDGVDLRALAVGRVRGVRQEHDTFETARAAAVGRLVAREVARHTPELIEPTASSRPDSRW